MSERSDVHGILLLDKPLGLSSAAAVARARVSAKPSSSIPNRMNRKFTDMVPVIPGRRTLSRAARIAISR